MQKKHIVGVPLTYEWFRKLRRTNASLSAYAATGVFIFEILRATVHRKTDSSLSQGWLTRQYSSRQYKELYRNLGTTMTSGDPLSHNNVNFATSRLDSKPEVGHCL